MTVIAVGTLFAHQGGWDEALLIGGPMVAIVGLLMLAKKRVNEASEASDAVPADSSPADA